MATTDACFKRITDELVMPGIGFWSVSQFQGSTLTGTLYFKGPDYGEVSILAPQGDGVTFHAGISGRSLNRVLNDACELIDEVNLEIEAIRAARAENDAPTEGVDEGEVTE